MPENACQLPLFTGWLPSPRTLVQPRWRSVPEHAYSAEAIAEQGVPGRLARGRLAWIRVIPGLRAYDSRFLVHSPRRLTAVPSRSGAPGSGRFSPC
ncbi:protein of unknown function [Streptantibioticus cattleyicolor NRRL 8057 = DSM 46488]|nr:protein of unknown function [Streptantibioticus cattleyicolor NRRL 8057 = DSM 46488]